MLINVSDHFTRTKANVDDAPSRVLGCLLGSHTGRVVEISNSFELQYNADGGEVRLDKEFLATKQDQCACPPAPHHRAASPAHY